MVSQKVRATTGWILANVYLWFVKTSADLIHGAYEPARSDLWFAGAAGTP